MEYLPLYIPLAFAATTLLAVFLLYRSVAAHKGTIITIALLWLLLQAALGLSGFYTVTAAMPPRFLLSAGPPLIAILLLFSSKKGRAFLDRLDTSRLTMIHIVRIPVELLLYALYLHKAVPELMTFAGRNADILSGLTAPLVYYGGFVKGRLPWWVLLLWNLACLALLLHVVADAVLSAPFPFQQFAWEQPNVAILHFPYVWLPSFIVPVVLLAHLAAIRKLLASGKGPVQ